MQSDSIQNNAKKIDYSINEAKASDPVAVPPSLVQALPVAFPDMPIPSNFSFLDDNLVAVDLTDSSQFIPIAVDVIRGEDPQPAEPLLDFDTDTLEGFFLGLDLPPLDDIDTLFLMPEEDTPPAAGRRNQQVFKIDSPQASTTKTRGYGADRKQVEVFRSVMKTNQGASLEEINAILTQTWNIQPRTLINKIARWSKKILNPDSELKAFMDAYDTLTHEGSLPAKEPSLPILGIPLPANGSSRVVANLRSQEDLCAQYIDDFKRQMEIKSGATVSQIDGALSQLWGRSHLVVRELIKGWSSRPTQDQKLKFLSEKYWTEVESTTLKVARSMRNAEERQCQEEFKNIMINNPDITWRHINDRLAAQWHVPFASIKPRLQEWSARLCERDSVMQPLLDKFFALEPLA
ncbi:MAG: hypothetical protein Q8K75_11500 [Chlamydiales bacterium]|nr:hypothetical protein [Chlamydiales bacterium]